MNDYASIINFQIPEFEVEELYSSTDTVTKDKVMSIRVEEGLYNLLEALSESWKLDNVAKTARTILSMFLLPTVYEFEYKNLVPEKLLEYKKQEKEQGFSPMLSRFHSFLYQLSEYSKFLNEAHERGSASMEFIEQKQNQVQEIVERLANMELALKNEIVEGEKK